MPIHRPSRRRLLAGAAGSALLTACGSMDPRNRRDSMTPPPIVFVHGNGDSAALWMTTIWRFESNGWPRDRLHAFDIPYPLARDDDDQPQEGRSSSADCRDALAAAIDRVLAATGAPKVVLVASSRGGYAVRNLVANANGAAKVSHAVLCGTPNHGVWIDPARALGSEFNGAGRFLTALNAPQGPERLEVAPGVRWLTIRSDNNDKYAQPDGTWIGRPGTPTGIGFDAPALRGAENVVLPGADHRETAFSPRAFEEAYRVIVGRLPFGSTTVREPKVVLDGLVSGYGVDNARGTAPSNLPLVGATVEVYATNPANGERLGPALHRKTIDASGAWGPFEAQATATHEFVVAAPGYATTHVYRSAFVRSSALVYLRPERLAEADRSAGGVVTLTRPAGYFGVPRNRIALDGESPPAGIPPGVAGVASARRILADGADRTVIGEFDAERLVGRVWPAVSNQLTVLELTS